MTYSRVLLVGAGQLGSRYLQGFVASNCNLAITVIDPSDESLQIAKSRWLEAGGELSRHEIQWKKSLPTDLDYIDVAFIVTSSKGRANLVHSIASKAKVRYWVLEKVLAQSRSELELIRSSVITATGAWVNTPRRMMRWHNDLKEVFREKGPLTISYSAGLWGLACNSIHFIDLVAWWTGESLLSVDNSGLAKEWFDSKRAGYFEIFGNLRAVFSGGTVLSLSAHDGAADQPLCVELNDGSVWEVDEHTGFAYGPDGRTVEGQIEFQSQLTGRLVDDILLKGQCLLPTLDESYVMHALFIDALLMHWNYSQNRNDEIIPIT